MAAMRGEEVMCHVWIRSQKLPTDTGVLDLAYSEANGITLGLNTALLVCPVS